MTDDVSHEIRAGRLRPGAHVYLSFIEDGSFLFDVVSQHLFYLNATATCIWCLLEESLSLASIVDKIAGIMRLDYPLAREYVLGMITTWRRLDLLRGHGVRASFAERRPPLAAVQVASSEEPPQSLCRISKWIDYRLLHINFSVGFSDPVLDNFVHPVLAHLEFPHMTPARMRLGIVLEKGKIQVWREGTLLASCETLKALAPVVQGLISSFALGQYHYQLALHAAGIGVGDNAMLIVAPSGSGKTTLAAALMASNCDYLSDDMILLRPDNLAVGVPYSLGIKSGGWRLLGPYFPGRRPTMHIRPDGQSVGYLSPTRPRPGFARPRRIRWVVFLRRSAGCSSGLYSLSRPEAVQRLFQQCCGIPHALTPLEVDRLVQWSGTVHWFELEMADLRTAVDKLKSLLNASEEVALHW
jgi:hypothetical protein